MSGCRVIVALDYADKAQALELLAKLDAEKTKVKIGKEMFTRFGPDFVKAVVDLGFDVFLDLKYHDIPNTVAAACRAAAELGVWMINVHTSGGSKMIQAARQALEAVPNPPLLVGVTILTSLSTDDIQEIGFSGEPTENVVRLARMGKAAGLDGVVCSPIETKAIRNMVGEDFLLVTPGVRPGGSASDDQVRIKTPADAILGGSSYLVIGRPITAALDPSAALEAISVEIKQALAAN